MKEKEYEWAIEILKKFKSSSLSFSFHKFLNKRIKGEFCEKCDMFVFDFEYQMCCDGYQCGCMGRPVEPCVCSDECWNNLINSCNSGDEYICDDPTIEKTCPVCGEVESCCMCFL